MEKEVSQDNRIKNAGALEDKGGTSEAIAEQKWLDRLMRVSPAVVHCTDSEGNLVIVNRRWCELTGRSASEAMGHGWQMMIHPEDRDALITEWQRYVREANRGIRKDGFCFAYRLLHKDGNCVRLCARCVEERDGDGKLLGFCAASLEVSERKVEEKISSRTAAGDDLSLYFQNSSPAALYRTDVNGSCLWVSKNWEELSGCPLKDALGNGWQRVIHPDDLQRLLVEWRRAIETRTQFLCESRYLRHDGSLVWVCSRISDQHDENGNLIGYLGVVIDITELRQKGVGNNHDGTNHNGSTEMKCSKLSKRENEVMLMLCDGLPNKLMAQRVGLSVRTIEAHRASIMRKLGLRSLAELVRYALKQSSSGK